MAKTRDEMIDELRNAGENVAHNIGDENLKSKYDAKFGSAGTGTGEDTGSTDTTATKKPSKVKVIIHSNDRENDEVDMVVGLNGTLHRIKLGEEVEIDKSLIKVIKNATETRYVSVLDKKGQPTGEVIERPRKRYLIESVVESEDE